MPRIIYKYDLSGGTVQLPKNATILKVAEQNDHLCLWANVDSSDEPLELRSFEAIPTGIPLDERPRRYIDTVLLSNGLVFHIYELLNNDRTHA